MVSEETLTNILGSQMQSSTKMRIGEMLLAQGYITQEQLDKALETQKTSGKRLGRTLVDLGFMPEERLIEILSRQFEVPYVKLDNFNIDPEAYTYLPEDMCKQYKVVPLFVQKGEDERRQVRSVMTIAMTDPTNMRTISIVKFKVRMDVDVVMASEADVMKAIERVFAGHGDGANEESLAELIGESKEGEELETVERGQGGNDEPELSDEEGRAVVKIVTTLIHEAIARKASDIHLEPQETFLKLRYRIDGDLQVMSPIPARLMPQILSRIKLLSKMDIAEKRKPLDGRFTVRYKGSEVDLRVSSFPISLRKRGVCEKIVMRILNPNSGQFPLKDMGFDPRVLKQFIDAINAPNGIVLVTGPTG
ncbi:MAG: Flp pilus assembly complex ATPase component TadA, partial [Fibrobacter sp.]|nr:Flp pilus assembly complex ATPase component TadA [Fibrobacter sp.]